MGEVIKMAIVRSAEYKQFHFVNEVVIPLINMESSKIRVKLQGVMTDGDEKSIFNNIEKL
jgi:hypothetical protein